MTDKNQTRLPSTRRSLPIALLRARETVMGPVREMLARSNLSEQKWRVLRVVEEIGPAEQTRIAETACLLLPSLTRMLQSMEDEGLVRRSPGQTDRRKSIVEITEAGRRQIAEHAQESNAIFDRLQSQFGKDRLEALLDLLDDLQNVRLK